MLFFAALFLLSLSLHFSFESLGFLEGLFHLRRDVPVLVSALIQKVILHGSRNPWPFPPAGHLSFHYSKVTKLMCPGWIFQSSCRAVQYLTRQWCTLSQLITLCDSISRWQNMAYPWNLTHRDLLTVLVFQGISWDILLSFWSSMQLCLIFHRNKGRRTTAGIWPCNCLWLAKKWRFAVNINSYHFFKSGCNEIWYIIFLSTGTGGILDLTTAVSLLLIFFINLDVLN